MINQNSDSINWWKAAFCALAFALFLFLLFTRSSCVSSSQNGPVAENPSTKSSESASKEQGKSENTSKSESDQDSKTSQKAENANGGESKDETAVEKEDKPGINPKVGEQKDSKPAGNQPNPSNGASGSETGSETEQPGGYLVGGLNIVAERLGVILDTSGSMTRYLDDLRTEIRSNFPSAVFLEVEGCLLEPSLPEKPDASKGSSRREFVINAIKELVEKDKVDSIYWFCDLQDEQTDGAFVELESLLLSNGSSNPIHLYIRSTDKTPNPRLEGIIKSSGGMFEKRR